MTALRDEIEEGGSVPIHISATPWQGNLIS
jgi:hypothetical protein